MNEKKIIDNSFDKCYGKIYKILYLNNNNENLEIPKILIERPYNIINTIFHIYEFEESIPSVFVSIKDINANIKIPVEKIENLSLKFKKEIFDYLKKQNQLYLSEPLSTDIIILSDNYEKSYKNNLGLLINIIDKKIVCVCPHSEFVEEDKLIYLYDYYLSNKYNIEFLESNISTNSIATSILSTIGETLLKSVLSKIGTGLVDALTSAIGIDMTSKELLEHIHDIVSSVVKLSLQNNTIMNCKSNFDGLNTYFSIEIKNKLDQWTSPHMIIEQIVKPIDNARIPFYQTIARLLEDDIRLPAIDLFLTSTIFMLTAYRLEYACISHGVTQKWSFEGLSFNSENCKAMRKTIIDLANVYYNNGKKTWNDIVKKRKDKIYYEFGNTGGRYAIFIGRVYDNERNLYVGYPAGGKNNSEDDVRKKTISKYNEWINEAIEMLDKEYNNIYNSLFQVLDSFRNNPESIEKLTENSPKIIYQYKTIRPQHLIGINNFYSNDINKKYFSWRWFLINNTDYRVVTIESSDNNFTCDDTSIYRPQDLSGINGYNNNIKNAYFSWRWFDKNENKYMVVTIEDGNNIYEGEKNIKPINFYWKTDALKDIEIYNFCWRWFKRDSESFRVLTLE